MELSIKPWGAVTVPGSETPVQTQLYTAFTTSTTAPKFRVQISDYGAQLVRIQVPDRTGKTADVVLYHGAPSDHLQRPVYFGVTVGRVANRIANGQFELEGKTYNLAKNHANNSLHGGIKSFSRVVWDLIKLSVTEQAITLGFRYVSAAGEENFPGEVTATVTYTITPMKVEWVFSATTSETTIVNMTNHAYWNLDGIHDTIHDQVLQLNCDRYMPVDKDCLVTGQVVPVSEQPAVDFRAGKSLRSALAEFGDIDNNFLASRVGSFATLNDPDQLLKVATLTAPKSGRKMTVETTEPCVQVFTTNFDEPFEVAGGEATCKKHSAICLETQRVPNAINMAEFAPTVILRPGQTYLHRTVHTFDWIL